VLILSYNFSNAQLFSNSVDSEPIPDFARFLGQTPPESTPKIFNLSTISGFFAADRITISPDNKEIFYLESNGYQSQSKNRIKYYKYSDEKWDGPFTLFEDYAYPAISAGGDTLFIQDRFLQSWYSVRNDTGWNAPVKLLNIASYQHYLQIVKSGRCYASSNADLNAMGNISEIIMGETDTVVQNLGSPLNNSNNGMDYFISMDESFIICVKKVNGLGDLYISYHKPDGSWTNPKNLGTNISSLSGWEMAPYVTTDNKYLFFTRQISDVKIFWVKIDDLIDSLKLTNFTPYVKNTISLQTAYKTQAFTFQVPDSIFFDEDANDTLIYSATGNNGSSLPTWLTFDPTTRTFSGITPNTSGTLPKTVSIQVIATDKANERAYASLSILVKNSPVGIKENENHLPAEFKLNQNYPNPFNPTTMISYQLPNANYISLKVFNLLGQEISTLINEEQSAGNYEVKFDASQLSSGTYIYKLDAGNFTSTKKMIVLK
jgi:hypothetical protein